MTYLPDAIDEEAGRAPSDLWCRRFRERLVDPPPVGGLARCLVAEPGSAFSFVLVGRLVRAFFISGSPRDARSTADGVVVRLVGSDEVVELRPPVLAGVEVAQSQRWADYALVVSRQRRGEPGAVVAATTPRIRAALGASQIAGGGAKLPRQFNPQE